MYSCWVCSSAPLLRWTLVGALCTEHAQSRRSSVFVRRHHHRLSWPSSSTKRDFSVCLSSAAPPPPRSRDGSTEGAEAIRWRNAMWTRRGYGKWRNWKLPRSCLKGSWRGEPLLLLWSLCKFHPAHLSASRPIPPLRPRVAFVFGPSGASGRPNSKRRGAEFTSAYVVYWKTQISNCAS